MTVCIAAIAEYEDIVTVTDKKLSKGFYSSEDASIKRRSLVGDWAAMLSGKIEQFQGFVPVFDELIGNKLTPRIDEVTAMLTIAYQKFAQQLAAEKILGRFDLDVPSFLKCRPDLGDVLYERLFLEISKVEVDFDLLVFGYHEEYPRIFIVSNPNADNPSHVTYCDEFGFGVVGDGYLMAESTLYALKQKSDTSLAVTLYNALCAKFAAETATDVGKQTFAEVFRDAHTAVEIPQTFIRQVRKEWERYGRPLKRKECNRLIDAEAERINERFTGIYRTGESPG